MDLKRSGTFVSIANIGRRLLQFAGVVYFSNVIGAQELGIFILTQAVIGVLSLPSDLGIRGSIEKRVSQGNGLDEIVGSALALKIPLVITVATIVYFLFDEQLNAYIGAEVALLLVVGLIVQEAAQFTIHSLNGQLRVAEASGIQLIQTIVWVLAGVFFVQTGYGGVGLVIASICGFAALLVLGQFLSDSSKPVPTMAGIRSVYSFAKFNAVTDVGWKLYSWVDVLIIGYFFSQAFVSAYEVSWRAGGAVVLFSLSVSTVIFPKISSLHAEGDFDQIENILYRSLTPSLLLVFPALFGTIALGEEILTVVFGPEFGVAYAAFIVLMIQRVFQGVHLVLGRSIQAMDEIEFAAKFKIISVTMNIILNVLLTPQFGLVGAAVATTLSYGFNTVAHVVFLSRLISIEIPTAELGWCVVSSLVMFGALLLYRRLIVVDDVLTLASALLLAVVVYFATLVFDSTLRTSIKGYLPARLFAFVP